jgi:hypothetical protein
MTAATKKKKVGKLGRARHAGGGGGGMQAVGKVFGAVANFERVLRRGFRMRKKKRS